MEKINEDFALENLFSSINLAKVTLTLTTIGKKQLILGARRRKKLLTPKDAFLE